MECVDIAARRVGIESLKPQQREAVEAFVNGNDVFVALPTGFGKSMIFGVLPGVFDILRSRQNPDSIVIVVSPLIALMKDLKEKFVPRGVSAEFIGDLQDDKEAIRRIVDGKHQLVFLSPENALDNMSIRNMLQSPIYCSNLVAVIVDEAHCIDKWGSTFRNAYARLGEIRSLVPASVNVMALTATATKKTYSTVTRTLGMHNPYCVINSPVKMNISYSVIAKRSLHFLANCIGEGIKAKGLSFPKTVVFCRTGEECGKLFKLFRIFLGSQFTIPAGSKEIPGKRVVEIYASPLSKVLKERVLKGFAEDLSIRVIIATIAFGMGVDFCDIRQVIHFGLPTSAEDYVQQSGRCGRDGQFSKSFVIRNNLYPATTPEMKQFAMVPGVVCRRKTLFTGFCGVADVPPVLPMCKCCDVCAVKCDCKRCDTNSSEFIIL